jgi:very-short-patch-repair endonuclease
LNHLSAFAVFNIDFSCHSVESAIEIDGKVHEKRKEMDTGRDKFLESPEISAVRIPRYRIFRNWKKVIDEKKAPVGKG